MTSKNLKKKEILTQFARLDLYVNTLISDQGHLKSVLESAIKCKNILDAESYKDCLKKMDTLNIKINGQIDKLCDLKDRIFTAINALESITERSVLWLHYVGVYKDNKYERLAFWQIANELSYSEARIKQLHISALEHLNI